MKKMLWFRRDLRVDDNALLSIEGEVLPLFIFDTHILKTLLKEDRRVSYIFEKVISLKNALQNLGLDLALFYGTPETVFTYLRAFGFSDVHANGDYERYAKDRDAKVSHIMEFHLLHDTYIFRPDEVVKDDGSFYKVFTPFYKRALTYYTPEHHKAYIRANHTLAPFVFDRLHCFIGNSHELKPIALASIGFMKTAFDPSLSLSVQDKLSTLENVLESYEAKRDRLDLPFTSSLSTELRFGTLSARALLRFLVACKAKGIATEPFFRQLVFREFYAMLLYHLTELEERSYTPLPLFEENQTYMHAVEHAATGIPVIDASLRQLYDTGLMHNRARMLCASFICKQLNLSWQWGEKLFAAYLMDYDKASNVLSWQWAAGTGIDAQPYNRLFNPYTQAKKFDPQCRYIKKHLKVLKEVPCRLLQEETMPLLENYPQPVVLHTKARKACLEQYASRQKHRPQQ